MITTSACAVLVSFAGLAGFGLGLWIKEPTSSHPADGPDGLIVSHDRDGRTEVLR